MKAKNTIKKKKRQPRFRFLLFIILLLLILVSLWFWLTFRFVDVIPDIVVTPSPTPCDINEAFNPVTQNDDWVPCEKLFDGIPMMLVPVGCYRSNNDSLICHDTPYWIDKYEVTNELYGSPKCSHWSNMPSQPAICLTWAEAKGFCESRDIRLPTEEEWEYVARGVDHLTYPWGNYWDGQLAHWSEDTNSKTEDVTSRKNGQSWVGAYNMSGNVWEWVISTEPGYYIAKGGSYNSSTIDLLETTFRVRHYENYSDNGTGFRCMRDLDG